MNLPRGRLGLHRLRLLGLSLNLGLNMRSDLSLVVVSLGPSLSMVGSQVPLLLLDELLHLSRSQRGRIDLSTERG